MQHYKTQPTYSQMTMYKDPFLSLRSCSLSVWWSNPKHQARWSVYSSGASEKLPCALTVCDATKASDDSSVNTTTGSTDCSLDQAFYWNGIGTKGWSGTDFWEARFDFEVIMQVARKTVVSCDVTPCSLIISCQCLCMTPTYYSVQKIECAATAWRGDGTCLDFLDNAHSVGIVLMLFSSEIV
jgi:hypothetical protein